MSIVAGSSAYLEGDTEVQTGVAGFLLHPVAQGVALAAALVLVLGAWFVGQARTEILTDHWNREVIQELMGLAESAAAIEAADKGRSEELLGVMLTRLPGTEGRDAGYRVLRLSGARLLASTASGDVGDMAAPRRLAREEKWLFDLGQGIRASVQTNRDEGIYRRRQVEVDEVGDSLFRISLPYFVDDKVAGIVQAELRRPDTTSSASLPLTVGMGIGAYLVTLLVLAIASKERREKDVAFHKPWVLFFAAVAILSVMAYAYGRIELGGVERLYRSAAAELAADLLEIKESVGFLAGEAGVTVSPGEENRWDVDLYQRPIGVIDGSGQIVNAGLEAQTAVIRDQLGRALRLNLIAGLVVVLFFGLGFARRLRRTVREHKYAYVYVMPAMIGMLLLAFFPFGYGILLSFTSQTVLTVSEPITELLVGFQNYINILGDFDLLQKTAERAVINYQNFYWTLYITVCWTIFNVTVGVTLGVILALVLNTKGLKYTNIYRVLLILPWAIPNYITALIWKGMFHQQFGVINQAIQMFGGAPIAWFDGVFSSFMTGLITNGWLSFPFMMVITLGALQSIPADLYEAATIDGADRWQQFRHVTLPSLKPTLIPAIIISVVWTFNMFNVIYLVSAGEPAGANEILITKSYKIAFEEYRYGYAAAYSVVIFFILVFYGIFQTKMTRATEAANA
jgi:arabinogalactan oligomer/maltooligosaccharide transport system permease protein